MARALRLAHRGDWRHGPENSVAAMAAALRNPACDGLEFDVRASGDGVPVLLHDETLERVQARPWRCDELTAAELAEAGIPPLEAVLALAGPTPFLDIELKGEPVPAVIELLERARGSGLPRTVVSSFEPGTLAWLGRERPHWRRWLNGETFDERFIAMAIDLGCEGISADWPTITAARVAKARAAGLEVAAWTVRRRATAARLERLGVSVLCVEAAALDG